MQIDLPPIQINRQGEERKVGFEFEYTGVPLDRAAHTVSQHFGGTVSQQTLNHYTVDSPEWGTFNFELDVLWMKKLSSEAARQRQQQAEPTLEMITEQVLSPIVSAVMPYEIITPPLPLSVIPKLDALCRDLRTQGAKGTGASPLYAFGLHLNPEMPDMEPERLHRYLAAFILLQDWLKEAYRMDITRQLMPFAKLFSEDYAYHILRPGYDPSLATLIDDYLRFNPTRNRALDMLPLFGHLDPHRVFAAIQDENVKTRPTFHYRMPNCSIDEPSWSIAHEWNLWVIVENLAEDEERLWDLRDVYVRWLDSAIPLLRTSWPDHVRAWMQKKSFLKAS